MRRRWQSRCSSDFTCRPRLRALMRYSSSRRGATVLIDACEVQLRPCAAAAMSSSRIANSTPLTRSAASSQTSRRARSSRSRSSANGPSLPHAFTGSSKSSSAKTSRSRAGAMDEAKAFVRSCSAVMAEVWNSSPNAENATLKRRRPTRSWCSPSTSRERVTAVTLPATCARHSSKVTRNASSTLMPLRILSGRAPTASASKVCTGAMLRMVAARELSMNRKCS